MSHINHGLLEKLETRRRLLATFSSFFSSFSFFGIDENIWWNVPSNPGGETTPFESGK